MALQQSINQSNAYLLSAWAFEALRAEASQVEWTCNTSNVFLGAVGTFGAKASVVLFAFSTLDGRVDMKVETIVAAVAEAKGGIEAAFGYPSHIVFVQVVALVALLAKTSEPMLAYGSLVGISKRR